ncbi:MAG TPA: MraY family glycosyltransferase [Steroidobacteraceae bacterium]|nr:MraY family glycosyltransferase [Steroidobacteraceae bacterium]
MTLFQIATAAIAALVITIAAVLALRPLAYVVDLLDRPGGHKTHQGEVPIVGGLAMLLGLVLGLSVSSAVIGSLSNFLVPAVFLAVVGMLDDRFDLPPVSRLFAQFAAVLPMFFGAGLRLLSFGDLFGIGPLITGSTALFATVFVTLAAINAFNMLDGIDGLAGGVAVVSLTCVFGLSYPSAGPAQLALAAVLMGSVVGFLVFNLPMRLNRRMRCFMGDAGSTLLGFSLAWLCISLSQGQGAGAAPITMVWLVGVPATELVWTTIRRLAHGHSPIRPDTEHLHHRLRAAGLGARAVFATMTVAAVLFALIGLGLQERHVPDWLSLLLLFAAGSTLVVTCYNGAALLRFMPSSWRLPVAD